MENYIVGVDPESQFAAMSYQESLLFGAAMPACERLLEHAGVVCDGEEFSFFVLRLAPLLVQAFDLDQLVELVADEETLAECLCESVEEFWSSLREGQRVAICAWRDVHAALPIFCELLQKQRPGAPRPELRPVAPLVKSPSSAPRRIPPAKPLVKNLVAIEALADWQLLLAVSRAIFARMYRDARISEKSRRLWVRTSVGWLAAACGYSPRMIKYGLAELRRGSWIQYIVRGYPQIGCSVWGIVPDPVHLKAWRRFRRLEALQERKTLEDSFKATISP